MGTGLPGNSLMSSPPLIDTHCHLDEPSFENDVAEVIQSANKAGIKSYGIAADVAQDS